MDTAERECTGTGPYEATPGLAHLRWYITISGVRLIRRTPKLYIGIYSVMGHDSAPVVTPKLFAGDQIH